MVGRSGKIQNVKGQALTSGWDECDDWECSQWMFKPDGHVSTHIWRSRVIEMRDDVAEVWQSVNNDVNQIFTFPGIY